MAVIDSNNFITHLVWSGLVDKATCGELKEAIELCTVKDIYTKDEVIAMLAELQDELKYTNLSGLWKTNYAEGFNDSVATSVKKIQCRIDKLKENNDETDKSNK